MCSIGSYWVAFDTMGSQRPPFFELFPASTPEPILDVIVKILIVMW